MRAGLLDETIELYARSVEKSEYGDTNITYIKYCTTKAKVYKNTGFRVNQNNEEFFGSNFQFTVRFYIPVSYTDQIHFQGYIYRVTSILKDKTSNSIVVETERVNE